MIRAAVAAVALAPFAPAAAAQCVMDKVHHVIIEEEDLFGMSAAVYEDTAIFGAPLKFVADTPSVASTSGAAYIFERQQDGTWIGVARLLAPDPTIGERFGQSVAIWEDWILVGAPHGVGFISSDPGRAYIYTRVTGEWVFHRALEPTEAHDGDLFGWSVDLHGDRAVVGSPGNDFVANAGGLAFTFQLDEATLDWGEIGMLRLPVVHGSNLGFATAIWEDLVMVGTPGDETGPGKVDVFRIEETEQPHVATVPTAGLDVGGNFGHALDFQSGRAIVGAPYSSVNGNESGAVHFLEQSGDDWTIVDTFHGAGPTGGVIAGDRLGYSVAMWAPNAIAGTLHSTGYARLYHLDGADWDVGPRLDGFGGIWDAFGEAVALQGDTFLVGAPRDDTILLEAGAGYIRSDFDPCLGGPPTVTSVVPATVPAVSVGVDPNVTVFGTDLGSVSDITVNGTAVDTVQPTSATEVSFAMPLIDTLGTVDVELENPNGTVITSIQVVPNDPPALQLGDGSGLPIVSFDTPPLTAGSNPGDVMFYCVSTLATPTVVPGLFSLDIGGNFALLVILGTELVGPAGWVDHDFGFGLGLAGIDLHFQALAYDPISGAFPLAETNTQTATVIF